MFKVESDCIYDFPIDLCNQMEFRLGQKKSENDKYNSIQIFSMHNEGPQYNSVVVTTGVS